MVPLSGEKQEPRPSPAYWPSNGLPTTVPLSPREGPDNQSPLSVLTVISMCPRTSTFCPIATPSRIPYLCPVNSRSSRTCRIASRLLGSPSLCLVLTPNSPLRALPPWGPGDVSPSCHLLTPSLGRTTFCSQTYAHFTGEKTGPEKYCLFLNIASSFSQGETLKILFPVFKIDICSLYNISGLWKHMRKKKLIPSSKLNYSCLGEFLLAFCINTYTLK